MDDIKKISEAIVAMLFAAYGHDALRFAHLYLDKHFPETGAANTNARAQRDARPASVRANQLMYLENLFRNAGGRELHIHEIMKAIGYSNSQHLSYDLRELKAKGDVRMGRKGYYSWVRRPAAA